MVDKHWFCEVERVKLEHFESRSMAELMERVAIVEQKLEHSEVYG